MGREEALVRIYCMRRKSKHQKKYLHILFYAACVCMCECASVCSRVCVYTLSAAGIHRDEKLTFELLQLVIDGCETLDCGCWELNLGPL